VKRGLRICLGLVLGVIGAAGLLWLAAPDPPRPMAPGTAAHSPPAARASTRRLDASEPTGSRRPPREGTFETELARLAAAPAGEERFAKLCAFVGAWSERSPTQASAWVRQTIWDDHLAAQLRGEIMTVWARQDLHSAIEGLVEDAAQPSDPALIALARRWAERDPAGAGQWVELIEDDWLRAELSREIAARSLQPRP
jgi:hypothetical protein